MLSSLFASMPAWRLVDPLPVLGALDDEEDEETVAEDTDEADGLEEMIEQAAKEGESW